MGVTETPPPFYLTLTGFISRRGKLNLLARASRIDTSQFVSSLNGLCGPESLDNESSFRPLAAVAASALVITSQWIMNRLFAGY